MPSPPPAIFALLLTFPVLARAGAPAPMHGPNPLTGATFDAMKDTKHNDFGSERTFDWATFKDGIRLEVSGEQLCMTEDEYIDNATYLQDRKQLPDKHWGFRSASGDSAVMTLPMKVVAQLGTVTYHDPSTGLVTSTSPSWQGEAHGCTKLGAYLTADTTALEIWSGSKAGIAAAAKGDTPDPKGLSRLNYSLVFDPAAAAPIAAPPTP